jgi:signal transduction histidine kinase/CheY-like chemotaxis protein
MDVEDPRPFDGPPSLKLVLQLVGLAAAVGALAYLCIYFTRDGARVAAIWPGNALIASALLRAPMRAWTPLALAGALGILTANVLVGDSTLQAVGLAAINVGECLLFALACRRLAGDELHLRVPGHLAVFGAACAFAPLVSGLAASTLLSHGNSAEFSAAFGRWFMADALGLLVVTPAFLALSSQSLKTTLAELGRPASLPPLLGLVIGLLMSFGPSPHPLPFLLFPALILCALRLSEAGVGVCLLISAAFAITASRSGVGPVSIMMGDSATLSLLLQLYLATATLMSLSLSAAFSERKRFQAEAERVAQAKAAFMANISHEIRTPLTAVVGYAGLLARREDLPADARIQIGRIADAGEGLLSIVNDVLDFSTIEAGRMAIRPEPSSVEQVVRSVLAVFAHKAEDKGIVLVHEARAGAPDRVMIDPNRLRQILVNLVGNAVKFTDSGEVRIAFAYRADEGQLVVSVRDSGCGMDEAQRADLFQRFFQVGASAARRAGGTGLGLAITRDLVEAMGGHISVESAPGRGSAFTFVIDAPACAAADEAPAAAEFDALDLNGVRVLVVDDNPTNRDIAKAILTPLGVAVTEAADGLEAVSRGQESPFDLILMDLRMPNMNGPDAARRLREEPGPTRRAPILAFSADIDAELIAGETGTFDGYVRKPLQIEDLILAVEAALAAPNLREVA